ncbi:baculoviral IAP repeat-containing protein 5-like [Watersipora subatra]|uniref:baculoviral IAP repeat-containing protein 5-like n=1 Tax=Watersipora subatra TaxID=2589382 RepID=UPI00355B2E72
MSADDTLTEITDTKDELNKLKDCSLCIEKNRLKTFVNWPFEDPAKCTAEAMAQAGFVHTPSEGSTDGARCFFCCKELDGWEADDDPWEEHVSHSRGKCKFLNFATSYETKIETKTFIELEIQRQKNIVTMMNERRKQRFKDQAQEVAKVLDNLV